MGRKALFEDGLLPLLERDMTDCRRDPIPQRLHVVDLVLDWKGVEPGRRQWQ